MLPRWHILLGAILTLLVAYFVPRISVINLSIIFLSSFLIDIDHYIASIIRSKKFLTLRKSLEYHKVQGKKVREERKKGIMEKGDFHFFHTIEFHILVLVLGFIWFPLMYLFFGMLFHSLIDFVSLIDSGYLYRREYLFVRWLTK